MRSGRTHAACVLHQTPLTYTSSTNRRRKQRASGFPRSAKHNRCIMLLWPVRPGLQPLGTATIARLCLLCGKRGSRIWEAARVARGGTLRGRRSFPHVLVILPLGLLFGLLSGFHRPVWYHASYDSAGSATASKGPPPSVEALATVGASEEVKRERSVAANQHTHNHYASGEPWRLKQFRKWHRCNGEQRCRERRS